MFKSRFVLLVVTGAERFHGLRASVPALKRAEGEVDDLRFRQHNNFDVNQPRKTRLLKVSAAAVLSLVGSCGGTAPRPTLARAQLYSVISEQPDPAAGTLTISIKVAGPATQANFKSAAESLIGNASRSTGTSRSSHTPKTRPRAIRRRQSHGSRTIPSRMFSMPGLKLKKFRRTDI